MQLEVMKIRNTAYRAIHEYFNNLCFCEVTPPVLTSFSCETACVGGSDLISVNYYNQKAYLSQSGQLYLEDLAMRIGRVYCIDPAFRAESTMLASHLSEFWMCEVEMTDVALDELIVNASNLIRNIVNRVLKDNYSDLQALNANIFQLKEVASKALPRITYSEAISYLQKSVDGIAWGEDISSDNEKIIGDALGGMPFVLTHFPKKLSSFYKKSDPENEDVVLSFDIIAPDYYRELVGASMRENDIQKLSAALKATRTNEDALRWYLDLVKDNPIPHGGYGLGIERLITWICSLESIQEAIPFPRTEGILCP